MLSSSLHAALVSALVAAAGVSSLPQDVIATPSSSSALPSSTSSTSNSSKPCNNSPTLCGRQYNAITHMGAHNSAFVRDASTGDTVSGNQYKNATEALSAGVRLLQAQVHRLNGTLHLCHSSCDLLDAGPLDTWLSTIEAWMAKNTNDVVTILLVNSDSASASDLGAAFETSGLAKLAFTPDSTKATGNWPTLQSMIDQGKRLVAFATDTGYDQSVSYLLPEFDFVFETPYQVTEIDGFNCTLDRPSTQNSAATALSNNFLSLINHFKYQTVIGSIFIPDVDSIPTVNSPNTTDTGNLGLHLQNCHSEYGIVPNFVLVDFWDQEDPIKAVDAINAVSDITGRTTVDTDNSSGASRDLAALGKGVLVSLVAAAVLVF